MNEIQVTAEPGKQEFFITRELNAPRELVFKAFTDPNLYVQWLGPRGITMTLVKFEPKTGGMWRYISKKMVAMDFGFLGVNNKVQVLGGLLETFDIEGFPGKDIVL